MSRRLRTETFRRATLFAALAFLLGSAARAETIDFEGIGTIAGPPFDLDTMGYTIEQIPTPGSPEPIIRPASLSPNGTDVYALCGFCAATAGFEFYRNDGARFGLVSIDLGGLGNQSDAFDFTLTGNTPAGGTLTQQFASSVPEGMKKYTLGAAWQNVTSVTVMVNNAGNAGYSLSLYDNIVVSAPVALVALDVLPNSTANIVYPNKSGKVPVAVLSAADFDATQVDPATIKFGLGEAAPVNAPVIQDVDGQFGPDATVKFKVEESGIFCDDTEVTMTGQTYSGERFAGSDSIDASECETGGCHPY